MSARVAAISENGGRRFSLAALLAATLVFAQVLFAAHADDLAVHAPQSCEICLAAAISDDPNALAIEIAPPLLSFVSIEAAIPARAPVAQISDAAHPRGPPFC